jgi:hypothetical protein
LFSPFISSVHAISKNTVMRKMASNANVATLPAGKNLKFKKERKPTISN